MKKKQWLPGIIVIVVIIGIVAGMRISNHLRTFGLSKSVLQGEQTPDAEETVRLCLYDVNRGETEQANQLMTDECHQLPAGAAGWWVENQIHRQRLTLKIEL